MLVMLKVVDFIGKMYELRRAAMISSSTIEFAAEYLENRC